MIEPPEMPSRLLRRRAILLGGIVGITTVFLILFALDWFPSMRGPDEWRWPYARPGEPLRHMVPLILLAVYGLVVYRWGKWLAQGERPPGKTLFAYLVFICLAIPVIQLALFWPDHYDVIQPLFFRTISVGASGVFTVGSRIDGVAAYLAGYPELMPSFPIHPQRYPPGLPLIVHATNRLLEQFPTLSDQIGFYLRLYQCRDIELMKLSNATIAAAIAQMILPLVSGLVVFPLYGLANRALGRQTAVWSVAFYPIVPSFALWAAIWDQFYPLLAAATWYFFYVGLVEERRRLIFLAGLLLSAASFLTFGILALLPPLGLWAIFWLWPRRHERGWSSILLDGLLFFLGVASIWLALQMAVGTSFWSIFQVAMGFHLNLGLDYQRWIWIHLYDFGIFLTIPLLILFVIGLALAVVDASRGRRPIFILAFGLGLLLLNLSGMSQGEVSRVWLFLTPFAVITAVWAALRLFPQKAIALMLALMVVQLVVFNAFLRVLTTGVDDPIARDVLYTTPVIAQPLSAQFGGEIQLVGYALHEAVVAPGDSLRLTLVWRSLQPISYPYTVFTQLLGPDNQVVAQQDNMPLQNSLPTTCWLPNEIVIDTYDISLRSDVPPGNYMLITGLYRLETGERLPSRGDRATSDNYAVLSLVRVD
jgi:hypothetical protein